MRTVSRRSPAEARLPNQRISLQGNQYTRDICYPHPATPRTILHKKTEPRLPHRFRQPPRHAQTASYRHASEGTIWIAESEWVTWSARFRRGVRARPERPPLPGELVLTYTTFSAFLRADTHVTRAFAIHAFPCREVQGYTPAVPQASPMGVCALVTSEYVVCYIAFRDIKAVRAATCALRAAN